MRSAARRTGRRASCSLRAVELEPTLERRYNAARAAWRMSDLPTVSVEMQRVLRLAREAGDSTVEGKALTALAEVALLREADLPKATELVDAALETLPEDGRSAALAVRGQIAWWVGDFETGQRVAEEALELAQRRGRKDLEAQALNDLWKTYRHQNRLDEAEELLARELEVAEESGSIVARAHALNSAGVFQPRSPRAGARAPAARGVARPLRRGGRLVDARPHAERPRVGGAAAGRHCAGGAVPPRGDPPA